MRPLAQRRRQRLGIDHAAARDVDEKALRAQRLEHLGIDHVARGRAAGRGADQHIGPLRPVPAGSRNSGAPRLRAACGCGSPPACRSRPRAWRSSGRWCPGRRCPGFLPETLGGCGIASRQTPARHWMSSWRMPRTMPISRPKAWSATQSSLVPAPLAVTMPRARSASIGRPSKPAPMQHTSSSAGMAATSSGVMPITPMVSTARKRARAGRRRRRAPRAWVRRRCRSAGRSAPGARARGC